MARSGATSRPGHGLLPRGGESRLRRSGPSPRWRSATTRSRPTAWIPAGRPGRRTRGPIADISARRRRSDDLRATSRSRPRRLLPHHHSRPSDEGPVKRSGTRSPSCPRPAAVPTVPSWHRSTSRAAYAAMEELGLEPSSRTGADPRPVRPCGLDGALRPDAWSRRDARHGLRGRLGRRPGPLSAQCSDLRERLSAAARDVYDVIPPSSPKEAREQGWPTSPLEAVKGVPTAQAWRHLGIVDLTLLDPFDDGLTTGLGSGRRGPHGPHHEGRGAGEGRVGDDRVRDLRLTLTA